MKKIKIIGTGYPYRGGLAAFNEQLARALQKNGYSVEIETFTLQYPNFLFPGKSQFADWDPPGGIKIKRSVNSVSPINWIRVGNRIAREQPDIVIFKYWLPFMAPCFGTIARRIRKISGARIITILDNIIPHEKRPFDRLLTRYFVKPVDGFIAMSRSVLDDLGQFKTKSPGIYSPHPLFSNFGDILPKAEAKRRLGLDQDTRYVLFFGLVREYKGLDLLLEAFTMDQVTETGVKLLVVGEFYTPMDKYISIIENSGLTDRVIIHPEFVPDARVGEWFCACDIVAQPYRSATQSGVTQIGYHFEKPMLVTNVGGLPEIIPDRVAGYVVEPEPVEIAAALGDFFTENRETSMTDEVRQEKKRFDWDTMVKNISLLIEQIETDDYSQ